MTKETETRNIYDIPVTHFPDRSARWLLSNIENVRGLLEILAGELVEYLDFSKMRIVNTSFMPNDLQGLEADVVLIVPFRDESRIGELLISILIEHQSTVDPAMALRVETYRNQIWRSQRRELGIEQSFQKSVAFTPGDSDCVLHRRAALESPADT